MSDKLIEAGSIAAYLRGVVRGGLLAELNDHDGNLITAASHCGAMRQIVSMLEYASNLGAKAVTFGMVMRADHSECLRQLLKHHLVLHSGQHTDSVDGDLVGVALQFRQGEHQSGFSGG